MLRIGASSHGESRLRMLRIVRRGDRHDPRDLTVSCRFEGDFARAFVEGRADGLLPGEALKNLVHATARVHGGAEIETFGLALCERLLSGYPRVTRARVDIAEQQWSRLESGGKAQAQAFLAGSHERRTTAVTSNGRQVAVVSGIEQLTIMRSSGFQPARRASEDPTGVDDGLQRLLVATLSARWTYSTPDVTFGPYRQGVRAAIVETFGCHASRSVQHALYSIADVVLVSYQEIADVTLSLQERPYRPADPFSAGVDATLGAHPVSDDLFVAVEEPLGVVEVTVERDTDTDPSRAEGR
jgi:urate oxidase